MKNTEIPFLRHHSWATAANCDHLKNGNCFHRPEYLSVRRVYGWLCQFLQPSLLVICNFMKSNLYYVPQILLSFVPKLHCILKIRQLEKYIKLIKRVC